MNKDKLEQKKEEVKHVNAFLNLLLNTSGKIYVNLESHGSDGIEPDFPIQLDNRSIGIEHTRLFHQTDRRGVNPVEHQKNATDIITRAQKLYEEKSSQKIWVEVNFRNDYGLNRGKNPLYLNGGIHRDSTAEMISDFILNHLPEPSSMKCYEYLNYDMSRDAFRFAEIIEKITICDWSKYNTSVWSSNEGGVVPGILSNLNNAIASKEEKPENYVTDYNELWLVVVHDSRRFVSYFDADVLPETIITKSCFDKVFAFSYSDNQILEMKTRSHKNQ